MTVSRETCTCGSDKCLLRPHKDRRRAALLGLFTLNRATCCIRCGQPHTGKGVVCNACDVGAG